VLALSGFLGFGAAIGAHPAVGYNDTIHIAPAVCGALLYVAGLILTFRPMTRCGGSTPLAEPAARTIGVNEAKSSRVSAILPPLGELGYDLLHVGRARAMLSLALPFVWCGAYFAFAALGWWPAAVFALVGLSFVTYGSVSHDLVHHSLGLPRGANDLLLCVVELLGLRSGHAYRAAHLNHHARYPHPDDVEATAARKSWVGALVEGVVFLPRIWLWAVRHSPRDRAWIVGEGIACFLLAIAALVSWPFTPAPAVYVMLMVIGSWVIPLVTSYVPHDPAAEGELHQTRAFRGMVASAVALGHLYHLEHHLYPSVPHHNWPRLGRRLDPYLERAGVRAVKSGF
jgi:beta-carotene hydroxylase